MYTWCRAAGSWAAGRAATARTSCPAESGRRRRRALPTGQGPIVKGRLAGQKSLLPLKRDFANWRAYVVSAQVSITYRSDPTLERWLHSSAAKLSKLSLFARSRRGDSKHPLLCPKLYLRRVGDRRMGNFPCDIYSGGVFYCRDEGCRV